jgi:3-methyladenine DNA glycosylase AlkD
MNKKQTLETLEKYGTAQNRKIYSRHGVSGKQFGVSYANLKKLQKQIKSDHRLAQALWKSGNHDARILATMIAEPEQTNLRELDEWAQDLDNYVITDAFSSFAAKTPYARKKMEKWSKSKGEWTGRAGWQLLAHLAMNDDELTNAYLENYVRTIEKDVHSRKNRVRDAMNSALIAIGIRNKKLERKALDAAKVIGKIDVDHGQTSCKTPDAVDYIKKAQHRKKKR